MKKIILCSFAIVALLVACHPEDDIYPISQDAFTGHYSPQNPIVQIRYDSHEEGVEAGFDSLTYTNRWNWNGRLLTRVDFDIEGSYYTNSPIYDDYYYNASGRLDSIRHHIDGVANPDRTYRFSYTNGLLSRISFRFGYTTDFLYRSGERYPYSIVFTHPLQDWLWDLYHTDTLVKRWTLEWENGNLVRATADSMAWYCTGMSKIEYAYDNNPNPMQGYFDPSLVSKDGFIDDPSCLCRNNLVRRTDYNYDNRNDTTYIHEYSWNYRYLPDGYPASVTYTFPTMYWTEITTTETFTYQN